MKKHCRLLAILLTLVMLVSFAACADNSSDTPQDTSASSGADTDGSAASTDNSSGNDTAAGTGESGTDAPDAPDTPYYLDTLTDKRYDGVTFTMIAEDTDQRPNFDVDTINGDTVNDAIYNRKITLEDRYGITIETVSMASRGKCNTEVKNKVLANDWTRYEIGS